MRGVASFCFALAVLCGRSAAKPNIVIIFADDLGWGDLSCYGHPTIATPNLDQMAREGIRFTQFYTANAICTPSRAALLTGRLPVRSGMYGTWNNSATNVMTQVLHADGTGNLPKNETTLPAQLKAGGHYHSKIIGKWHLGIQPDSWPLAYGFDEFFGTPMMHGPNEGNQSVFPDMQLINNTKVVGRLYKDIDIHMLNIQYIEAAVSYIKTRAADDSTPFFLYFAPDNTHIPLFASPRFQNTSARGLYGDCVQELDYGVGQVLTTIKQLGIENNTFVFFTSDNGPDRRPDVCKSLPGEYCDPTTGGSAGLLRGGKSTTWEGGIREPGIGWWPGVIKPGQVTMEIGSVMDLFGTAMGIAGIPLPSDRVMDTVSLLPTLEGKGPSRDHLFHWRGNKLMAVRLGPYKAHFYTEGELEWNSPPLQEHNPPILYHIEHDPSENYPIDKQSPDYAPTMEAIKNLVASHLGNLTYGTPQMNICDKHECLWRPDLPVPPSKPYNCCQDPCSTW
ncbi:N-acetylgalactosamine-6-sulfatase-like [Oscarella lobularis]|uniref:N-acetylgalactosamine-6-sulfatase-like n=1 Tax=Oscarella lobularis TaxID=121494 RepID=UPI003313C42E